MSELTFSEYQKRARATKIYPLSHDVLYPLLGLVGEVGEVVQRIKKIIRDHPPVENSDWGDVLRAALIVNELGDVMWYVAALASDLGLNLSDIATLNLEKLADRARRGKLSGSGDNR